VALTILANLFRSREVEGVNCTEPIWDFDALRRMTQQQPG
jgi:agmatine/peptidylarginine deiminase